MALLPLSTAVDDDTGAATGIIRRPAWPSISFLSRSAFADDWDSGPVADWSAEVESAQQEDTDNVSADTAALSLYCFGPALLEPDTLLRGGTAGDAGVTAGASSTPAAAADADASAAAGVGLCSTPDEQNRESTEYIAVGVGNRCAQANAGIVSESDETSYWTRVASSTAVAVHSLAEDRQTCRNGSRSAERRPQTASTQHPHSVNIGWGTSRQQQEHEAGEGLKRNQEGSSTSEAHAEDDADAEREARAISRPSSSRWPPPTHSDATSSPPSHK